MDPWNEDDLKRLSEHKGLAVSLYLPTHRAGADTRENAIRFKNRVQEARQQLEARGLEPSEIEAILAPAHKFIDDNTFWQQQADGLAMFLSEEGSSHYRLPLDFDELSVVAERYHLKPLMPLMTGDGLFYVLALSIGKAKLYEATRSSIRKVELSEDTPTSMDEALKYDDPEKSPQSHSTSGSNPGGARPDVTYHGTGAGDDDEAELLLRYLRALENGVTDTVNDTNAPLLVASQTSTFGFYQQANHYPKLLDMHLSGNPDDWSEQDLHEKAWALMEGHFNEAKIEAMQNYKNVAHTETASADLKDIVLAAVDARVDTLIVGLGAQRWGHFDAETREVNIHDEQQEGDSDLLDLAAVRTFTNGGTVYAVPAEHVPDGGVMVATYRW